MRQIVLDTETTGIGHRQGHRIIEIGCVELVERKLTGSHYHVYLNPERPVDPEAFRVHGLGDDFLAKQPLFKNIAREFFEYIKGAELVIHNAPFDMGFIDMEFSRLCNFMDGQIYDHCAVLDTLALAKTLYPGQKNSLDALCRRLEIDNSKRDLHGALLDAEILATVYLQMTGGQAKLELENHVRFDDLDHHQPVQRADINRPLAVIRANDEELQAHDKEVELLEKNLGRNLWHFITQ